MKTRIAAAVAAASITVLGATAIAPLDASPIEAKRISERDSGWGCGGAC